MTVQPGSLGGKGHDQTLGVGHRTSGEEGATPGHETMRETGGSGGTELTGNQVNEPGPPPSPRTLEERLREEKQAAVGNAGATIEGARGAQDTRASQAGGTPFGLGTPESGANQSVDDLEHPVPDNPDRRKK